MKKYVKKISLILIFIASIYNVIKKNITQLKAKDFVKIQDWLEVMMKALMGKMDKMSIEMIRRQDVPSLKEKKIKRST